MTTETRSYVDIFFDFETASEWISTQLDFLDILNLKDDEWFIKDVEIKLMPSGGYRAGVIFQNKQYALFD